MSYQKAAYHILQTAQKPMSLRKIAKLAFEQGLVTPRKKGMSDEQKIRSFVETVKRNIRDIIYNDPELTHPGSNLDMVSLPEWEIKKPSDVTIKQNEVNMLIGKVSSYFNGLEKYIQTLIIQLIGQDIRIGEIVTAELSFRNLISLLFSLYKYRKSNQHDINHMEKICKKALDLESKRNKVIHSIWAVNDKIEDDILRIKVTAKYKHGLKHTYERTDTSELHKISQEIVNLISEISELTRKELK